MKKLVYLIFIAILIFLCIGFAGFNSGQIVSVKFLGLRLENEFWIFMIVALLLGLAIGYVFASMKSVKHRMHARSLNKKLTQAKKEVSSLKKLPVKEVS